MAVLPVSLDSHSAVMVVQQIVVMVHPTLLQTTGTETLTPACMRQAACSRSHRAMR